MAIFDILGPVMVGPSSSHTAGAVRIGRITKRLLGAAPVRAKILLSGSFASTGEGHGTPRAIVAGLLGLTPDDERIPESFGLAAERGLEFELGVCHLKDAHPNSALITAWDADGGMVEVGASSPGGGMIRVFELDGLKTSFSGQLPTLIVKNADRPGYVSRVSAVVACHGLNISTLRMERDSRGGHSLMVIECDQHIPHGVSAELREIDGIYKVTRLNPDREV